MSATAHSELADRLALVTGGGRGIGRACARALAAAGATVRILDIDAAAAEKTAADVGGEFRVCDLTDPDSAAELAVNADIVVNNAGVQHVAAIEEFPPQRFAAMLRLMVEAPFRLVRAALPHMYAEGWGRIVNISSVHGLRASAYKSAYVTAKHALEGFSKAAALEGGPRGVTSNCINPGYVRTPLVEGQLTAQASAHGIPEEDVAEQVLLARSPMKRLIEPAEVAAAVVYLCGPHAAGINGASWTLDGGWTAS
jgi:3-hydroxybutyrate dehydrogenase